MSGVLGIVRQSWGDLQDTWEELPPPLACDRRHESGWGCRMNVTVRTKLIIVLLLIASNINGAPPGAGSAAGGGSSQKTPLFETYSDWDREVKRTGASGWRVCSINEGYMISTW